MLPDNFDFAMLPSGSSAHTLRELGMLESTIENIDYAMMSWVKEDLGLRATTNEGFVHVPVLWQVPERSYQVKHEKALRDSGGALKLPLISVERTGVVKDPSKRGAFQANTYSVDHNGRSGRMVLAKRIVQDKTRNFAGVGNTRNNLGVKRQRNTPRVNKKIVIQSLSIPTPVYVTVTYKINIKSEYQQQMNEMVAPFMTRTGQANAFTMRRNGHLYEAFIQQDYTQSNNVNNLGEDMRMYNTDVTIEVLGYLIGEGENDDRPIVRVDENTVEVSFPQEQVAPPGVPNIFGKLMG